MKIVQTWKPVAEIKSLGPRDCKSGRVSWFKGNSKISQLDPLSQYLNDDCKHHVLLPKEEKVSLLFMQCLQYHSCVKDQLNKKWQTSPIVELLRFHHWHSVEYPYGAMFTCMNCWVVHIEITHSLDTDASTTWWLGYLEKEPSLYQPYG